MKKNMGAIDRIIRTVLAVGVFVFILAGKLSGIAALILGIVAVIFLATSFTGVCPLYTWMGITTLKRDNHDETHHGATPRAAH